MRFQNSVFKGGRVVLDGNEYVNCTFEKTVLVFAATKPVTVSGCRFLDVQWALDGPAALTIQFLRGLFHEMGPHGPKLVEQLFDAIRADAPMPSAPATNAASPIGEGVHEVVAH
jgi:hypothetical protein